MTNRYYYSFLWVLPFVSFLAGYQLLRNLTHAETVTVSSVVGLHIHDAIKTLSADRLNVRILAEKEDPDIAEGIIMSQTPYAGRVVKPHQSIFLVISRKPPKPKALALFGLVQSEAEDQAKRAKIELREYSLESLQPENTIIAQEKLPLEDIQDGSMAVYLSSGTTPIRIMPSLKGRTIEDVTAFFKPYAIKVEVSHPGADHECATCIIAEQHPLAGTLVNIKKGFTIRVTAESPK